jgi:hypothetical protein
MITTRFFGGGASSVAINLVGGSIADIWKGPKGEYIVFHEACDKPNVRTKYPNEYLRYDLGSRYRSRSIHRRSYSNQYLDIELALDLLDSTYR